MPCHFMCLVRQIILAALLALLLAGAAPVLFADEQPAPHHKDEETWAVLFMGKSRVGYMRTATQYVTRDGQTIVRTHNESYMIIKRFGQDLKMRLRTDSDELDNGDLLSFTYENDNPPVSSTSSRGVVKGDELILDTTTAGKTKQTRKPWDQELKSSAYQDRVLKEHPLEPGEKRTFKTWVPEFNQAATVGLKGIGEEETTLLDGTKRQLMRIDVTQSIAPGIVTRAYLDKNGEMLKTVQSLGLGEMVSYTVPREEALKTVVGAELDLALDSMIKAAPIPDAHRTHRIVYRVKTPHDDPAQYLSTGDTQSIKRVAADTVDLTVAALPPPTGAAPSNGKVGAEYLEPNDFLQSDDKRVIALAKAAAGDETDPWKAAVRMEKYVHDNLKNKNFSTALASAAEVAEKLEGDCTEHACLLAAMARVYKIPSRVAVGLVYADRLQAFGGHMWTEVCIDGTWYPLDATLGRGGIGAAHIKMADSSFSDAKGSPVTAFLPLMNALGKMTLEVREVE